MVPDGLDGSRVVIQNPLYFRKIRDSGSETLIFGQGEGIFDSPRPSKVSGTEPGSDQFAIEQP